MSTRRNETDLAVQSLRLVERAAPASPPSGTLFAYAKADGLLYTKSDAGVETAHSGDPWTVLKLAADFSTSSVAAQDVTGLGFTPAANTTYVIEAFLPSWSAAAATGIQFALAGPSSGINFSGVTIRQPMTATTEQFYHGVINTFNTAGTALTTMSLAFITAIVGVGANPGAGNLRVQLKSEVNNSAVSVKAGAVMLYRAV
jgi:hypothetical protein